MVGNGVRKPQRIRHFIHQCCSCKTFERFGPYRTTGLTRPLSMAFLSVAIKSPTNDQDTTDQFTNPYTGCAVVGLGMTGLILYLNEDRVVKIAKTFTLDSFPGHDQGYVDCINDANRDTLKHEKSIYERLGNHTGIITCFKASDHGIELSFAKQGNLESYIETTSEPHEPLKIEWILSLTDTLTYIHSRRVFVDEIALRNILVTNGQLNLSDFGQSYLLPLTADVDTISENDLTAKIEILHLGWIIYSIAVWGVHKYYYFESEDPKWPNLEELPSTNHLFCGAIIRKCWTGDYISMNSLNQEAHALLEKAVNAED